jgi:hypothetical protein
MTVSTDISGQVFGKLEVLGKSKSCGCSKRKLISTLIKTVLDK